MRFSEMNVNEGTPNKVAALLILEILREYTDENHTVTRQWLAEKLAKKDFTIDPKTIVRHLVALKNLGYPIEGLSGKIEDYKRLNAIQFSDLRVNAQTPKSLAIVLIYEILREYSDEEHSLSRKKIIEILAQKDFSMDKKAVGHYLEELLLLGVDVEGLDIDMIGSTKKQGNVYIEPNFNKTELQLLMDSVLFSKHISSRQAKDLIEKIGTLGNRYFKDDNIALQRVDTVFHTPQKTYLYDMQLVQQAITADKDISFVYGEYSSDKTLKAKSNNEHLVSPYYLVVSGEHYYLIAYNKAKNDIVHYRLDKMRDLKMKKTQRVDIHNTSLKGVKIGDYLESHPFMYVGAPTYITIQLKKAHIDYVLHTFGDNFSLEKETDTHYVLKLQVNEDDMFYWALQYGTIVEVLEPQTLRDRIRIAVEEMAMRYLQNDGDRYEEAVSASDRANELVLEGIDISKRNKHEKLINLRSITLSDNNVSDISFVEKSKRTLHILTVRNNPVKDISCLKNIYCLRKLDLDTTGVEDISPLAEMGTLHYLRIANSPITSLNAFAGNRQLEDLSLEYTEVNDFSFLKDLPRLKELTVYTDKDVDETVFYELKGLTKLSLSKNLKEKLDESRVLQNNPELKCIGGLAHRLLQHLNSTSVETEYPYSVLNMAFGPNKSYTLSKEELISVVEPILGRLTQKERLYVKLRLQDGKALNEISTEMGCSLSELDRLEKQIRKKLSHKSYCGALEKYVEPQNPDVNYRKYL